MNTIYSEPGFTSMLFPTTVKIPLVFSTEDSQAMERCVCMILTGLSVTGNSHLCPGGYLNKAGAADINLCSEIKHTFRF